MTSPALNNGNNGQKETSKTASSNTLAQANQTEGPSTRLARNLSSPFTAWWRVFKMCNLLSQQKC